MRTRRFIICLVYALAYYAGIVHLCYWLNRKRILVLTYHNIIPDRLFDCSPHLAFSHPASVFREHLRLISRRFLTSGWPAKSGACVITFDDGYLNQWEIAGPILDEFNAPAIYFVPFKPIEDGKCLVVDDLLKWFSYAPLGSYEVYGETIVLTQDARIASFVKIYCNLLEHPARWSSIRSELDKAVKFADLKVDVELERLRFTPLRLDQLEDMRTAGHQIGCHSWEHLPLASLSPQQLARDFERCVSKIDRYANTRLYCYPFGSGVAEVTHEATVQCSRSGFQWAFLNTDSIAELCCDPEYAVPRMSLPNTADRYLLEAKLSGFEGTLQRMRKRWTSVLPSSVSKSATQK